MPMMKPLATIHIRIDVRKDGSVYISSDDMPGLWLWGKDQDQVYRSIIPTIKELYKYGQGEAVKVIAAQPSGSSRWYAQEKINDTYLIYPAAHLSEHTMSGT